MASLEELSDLPPSQAPTVTASSQEISPESSDSRFGQSKLSDLPPSHIPMETFPMWSHWSKNLPKPKREISQNLLSYIGQFGGRVPVWDEQWKLSPDLKKITSLVGMGSEIMEVFSISIKGWHPGGIYGKIFVRDALGVQTIYDRPKEKYESINPDLPDGHPLLLTPSRYIDAVDPVDISLLLLDKDNDNEVPGLLEWNPITGSPLDKPCSWSLQTSWPTVEPDEVPDCSVMANFMAIADAVSVNLEITLNNSYPTVSVHGLITAPNANFEDCVSVLFQKELGEDVELGTGLQLIPLSKSVVPVKMSSSLRVVAKLYDGDREIVNGTAEFSPQLFGEFVKNISGNNCELQVKVTWVLVTPPRIPH